MCISFHPNLLHEHKLEQDVSVGKQNLVKLNAYMIQFLPISLLKIPHNFPIYFNGSVMLSLDSVNILSIDITSTLFEEHNIIGIAESASKKLGVLFQSQNFFYSEQLFHLYKNDLSLRSTVLSSGVVLDLYP